MAAKIWYEYPLDRDYREDLNDKYLFYHRILPLIQGKLSVNEIAKATEIFNTYLDVCECDICDYCGQRTLH